jgi:hypothetical protein
MPDLDEGGAPAGRVGGPVGHLDGGCHLNEKKIGYNFNFEICVFDIEYVASNKVRCDVSVIRIVTTLFINS